MQRLEIPWPRQVASFFVCIRHLSWPQWLDSGEGEVTPRSRWHLMVAAPRLRILCEKEDCRVMDAGGRVKRFREEPLRVLRAALAPRRKSPTGLPFTGGALGYFSYDLGRRLMGLESAGPALPEMAVGIYDWAILLDRRERRAWIAGENFPSWLPDALTSAAKRNEVDTGAWRAGRLQHLLDKEAYLTAIGRIHHYLREGDCYQVNYAQPFEAEVSGDPLGLYLSMRRANPVPYGACLLFPFATILSASPEQFLWLRGDRVATRPIKGTRPRGVSPGEDERLRRELARSAKDRAENLMIVDLLRNDLGKVCRPGSIRVPELFAVESFPTVHHLVSEVQGRLAAGEDALSLLQACFPGGSITGAPKRRAMEIIQELEGRARDLYCGSIGWIGYHGDMETSIAIRTLQIREGLARYWAGGGIVIDSEGEAEYRESLHKAAAFFELLEQTSHHPGSEP